MLGIVNAASAAAQAIKAAADKVMQPQAAQHTVAQRETYASVGAQYGVSADAIRAANPQLPPFVEPPVGTILTIPEAEGDEPLYTAAPRPLALDGGGKPGEPLTVDQAVKNLDAAEAELTRARDAMGNGNRAMEADLGHYETAVTKARADLRGAIDRDVTASADARPTGSINDAAHVKNEGALIAARYEGNPAAKAAVEREVAGLAIDREVADTKTILLAQTDPAQMGKLMTTELPKLSPEAQARLLQDPEIRRWIAGDFGAVDPSKIATSDQQMDAAGKGDAFARRLADLTAQLPPEQAEALTRTMMPEIRKLGHDKMLPVNDHAAGQRFTDLSRVVGALGHSPGSDALVDEIARSYTPILAGRGNPTYLVEAATTADGGGPRLAVAIARTSEGRDDLSPDFQVNVMNGVRTGLQTLQSITDYDMKAYGEHLAKVDAATRSLDGLPGAEDARQKYIDSQPQAFKDRMNQLSGAAADSGTRLTHALAGLGDLPEGFTVEDLAGDIIADKTMQVAMTMGAQKNPDSLLGTEGKQVIEVLTGVKIGKEATEFGRSMGTLIVGANQSNAIDLASKGDIEGARKLLGEWSDSSLAQKLGIDPKLFQEMNGKLTEVVSAAGDPVQLNAKLAEMRTVMDDRGGLMSPDTPAGRLFRGLNVTASMALAGKSLNEALTDGGLDKWLSAIGDGSGVVKDGGDLIAAMMGKSGTKATARFIGVFGGISVLADVVKIGTGETNFDKGAAAISAMGGGFMLAAGFATTGAATFGLAFVGAALIAIIEWAKGEKEQEKQLQELNRMSGEALQLLVEHGLDPAAIPELRRRGGDSGEFAAAPVLVQYLAGRGYSPEEALAWINDAQAQGKLDDVMNTAVTQSAELGENPGDTEVKAESDAAMEKTIRDAGLPLK